jgi:hypothetical protein
MANENEPTELTLYLATVARAIGYLSLREAELDKARLPEQVQFLERLGFDREDCARILDSTPESIRVNLAKSAKKKSR